MNLHCYIIYFIQIYRKGITKYLLQCTTSASRRRQKPLMGGLLGTFDLQDFDTFFNNYRSNNSLAVEALTALECFIASLNEFLELCEGLNGNEKIIISWYSYANISSSGITLGQKACIITNLRLAMCQST